MPYTLQEQRDKFLPYLFLLPPMQDNMLVDVFVCIALRYINPNHGYTFPLWSLDRKIIESLPKMDKGDMNYVITWLTHKAVIDRGLRYTNLNDLVDNFDHASKMFVSLCGNNKAVEGMFRCAQLEFYRTVVAPYEDKKKEENGPVSELGS